MHSGVVSYNVSIPGVPGLLCLRENRGHFDAGEPLVAATPAGAPVRRWAEYILSASEACEDPRTLAGWSRAIGVSRSVLIESCARLGVAPRDARDLARVLRLVRRVGEPWDPDMALDVADRRTLRALLLRAGLTGVALQSRPSPEQFLLGQRFVPQTSPGLGALRHLLGRAAQVMH